MADTLATRLLARMERLEREHGARIKALECYCAQLEVEMLCKSDLKRMAFGDEECANNSHF